MLLEAESTELSRGVKHLCRQRDCAGVTTDFSCSRVGNPRVQSLSQFLREKSRTSRKGERLQASFLAVLDTQRTLMAQKGVGLGHILARSLRVPWKTQIMQLS